MSAIVAGRRFCSSEHHKGQRWLPVSYFYVSVWADKEKTQIKRLQAHCQACQRIGHRYSVGMKRRGKPFEQRTRMSREERLARKREAYHSMTPEQRADRREQERIRATERRRAAGVPIRNLKRGAVRLAEGGYLSEKAPRLPAKPFVEFLKELRYAPYIQRRFAVPDKGTTVMSRVAPSVNSYGHFDVSAFCGWMNISKTEWNSLMRLARSDMIDSGRKIEEELIDRVLTAIDQPFLFHSLYPDAYEDAA